MTAMKKTLAIIVHVASHNVHNTVHGLHNAMRWESADSIVGEWKFSDSHSWKQYNRPHFTVYNTHFTLLSIFLNALLLMQTEHLCIGMHYLTKHIIKKDLVKVEHSILYHTRN
jgi:hypothetical protein